jgi:predicted aspartyl protease
MKHRPISRYIRVKCLSQLQIIISLYLFAASLFFSCTPFPFASALSPSLAWGASSGAEADGAAEEAQGEIYKYTDRDGVIHFVDSLENIPRVYRKNAIARKVNPPVRQTTGVVITDNQIHVPVSFRNRDRTVQATLILDTGASITCMTEELAGRLGIDLESARVVSMGMADGSMVDIWVTMIDSVTVGDRMRSPFKIGILPRFEKRQAHEGYLGLDFLSAFQHRIDFQNSLIRWQ